MLATTGFKKGDVVEVKTEYEMGGLSVHRSVIDKKFQTDEEIYTISHQNTGLALIIGFDSLGVAIACCEWLVAEGHKQDIHYSDIKTHMRDTKNVLRDQLKAIMDIAREKFLKDDDDCY